ncbi:zf-HC2 domain-containing protein [bacterium]|nr:zf-HC2 domain-containing protein [bacterium]
MRCPIDEGLMIDYLEGILDETERERVRDHIRSCPGCAERLLELNRVRGLFAAPALRRVEMPPEQFWNENLRAIEAATWRMPRQWRSRLFRHAAWKMVAAAAAVLLVFLGVGRMGVFSPGSPSLAGRQSFMLPVEQDSMKVMRRMLTDCTLAAEYLQTVSDLNADTTAGSADKTVLFPAGTSATVYDGLMDLDEEQLDGVMAIMAGN